MAKYSTLKHSKTLGKRRFLISNTLVSTLDTPVGKRLGLPEFNDGPTSVSTKE